MEDNKSGELQWFVNTLQNEFSVEVDINDIGVEATELGIDEVDDFFVPSELFDELPYTLIYEIMIVDDEEKNVWVGAVAFYPDSHDWCLQVVTKNGNMVLRNLLSIID